MNRLSILRCFVKLIPSLSVGSGFFPQPFWLDAALLQTGIMGLFMEAAELLRIAPENMMSQEMFDERGISSLAHQVLTISTTKRISSKITVGAQHSCCTAKQSRKTDLLTSLGQNRWVYWTVHRCFLARRVPSAQTPYGHS